MALQCAAYRVPGLIKKLFVVGAEDFPPLLLCFTFFQPFFPCADHALGEPYQRFVQN